MNDQMIVELYLCRDERAIEATAEKYGKYCTSIAKNILGCREEAQECVNDTYLHTWNAIPPHKPTVLATFLGKITRNLAFNRYKHNTADKRGGGELLLVLDELAECVTGADSVERSVEQQDLTHAINEFLDALPLQKRDIFICRYWYTDSIPQIASRFGKKESAVAMTLSRLRHKLREHLTERGFLT